MGYFKNLWYNTLIVKLMMNENVDTIMITRLITLSPKNTLQDVRNIFLTHRIHHIPVVEKGKLVGLVTTYDLWKSDIAMDQYDSILVSDIMTTRLIKISPDDKIGTAAELFLDNRFHALPVVQDGLLVGLVTSFDILRYEFRKEYPEPILFREVLERGLKVV